MLSTAAIDKVLERTTVPLTVADARAEDFPLLRVNKPFCALSGYTRAEMIGRNCRFMQGELRDQPGREELALALTEHRDTQVVLRNFTRFGDPFDNLLFIHHIKDASGALLYVMGSQFRIADRGSARNLDDHITAMENGLRELPDQYARLQMNVRRQLSNSMAAMLDSAILYERMRQHVDRGRS